MRSVLIAALIAAASAGAAAAGEVCNETSYMIDVAKAWRTPTGLSAEGWTRIAPGGCAEVGPRVETDQFLYARTTRAYLGGVREWRGGLDVCVDETDFSFEGVADCEALGLQTRQFRQLGMAERERAVLVELGDFGTRAEEAGLQRLLQSSGYDIRIVDGYAGRRTRRQIAAFEANVEQSFGADRAALIDALHAYALERNADAGLRICNRAETDIAAAVARAAGDGWQVRGWWRIAPGVCAQAVSARLTANETYVYARLMTEQAPRPIAGGRETFCIAPSRFTSDQREACTQSGLEAAAFRAAPDPEAGGATLVLTEADFEEPLP